MKVQFKKTQTEEINLPAPCFFRDKIERNYIGLLDEKTIVIIYDGPHYKSVRNLDSSIAIQDLADAYGSSDYTSCTETEFLQKFDEVIESISLHAILVK